MKVGCLFDVVVCLDVLRKALRQLVVNQGAKRVSLVVTPRGKNGILVINEPRPRTHTH